MLTEMNCHFQLYSCHMGVCVCVCVQPFLKSSEARTPQKGSVAWTPQRLQPCAGGDELVLKMHTKQGTLLKERLFAKVGSIFQLNLIMITFYFYTSSLVLPMRLL